MMKIIALATIEKTPITFAEYRGWFFYADWKLLHSLQTLA